MCQVRPFLLLHSSCSACSQWLSSPIPRSRGALRSALALATNRRRTAMSAAAAAALPLARVRLLSLEGTEPIVSIQLEVGGGKQRLFNRPANALLDATLRRMQLSLAGKKKKKKNAKTAEKKSHQAAGTVSSSGGCSPQIQPDQILQPLTACLRTCPGGKLMEGVTNAEAWRSGTVLELQGHGTWRVETDLPYVVSLRVPGADRAMVGLKLHPNITLEHADTAAECQWRWTRMPRPSDHEEEAAQELVLSDQQQYTPTQTDIGHMLRVCCVPTRNGSVHPDSLLAEATTSHVTSRDIEGATSGIDIPEFRSAWTAAGSTKDREFRVMCYNILANVYANTSEAREELFPYCPALALDIDYRAQLVIREIIASKADIVCLQEVDRAVFDEFLRPALLAAGYEAGVLLEKSASSREGVATFIRNGSGFRVDEYLKVCLGGGGGSSSDDSLKGAECTSEKASSCAEDHPTTLPWKESDIVQQLAMRGSCYAETMHVLRSVSTKAQILVLRRQGCSSSVSDTKTQEQVVVVANTHLHYHPLCSHIRALQLENLLSIAHDKVTQIRDAAISPAFVLCGDLNTQPSTSAGLLLRTGTVDRHHPDWRKLNRYFAWDPTPAQAQQSAAVLRELRERERAARERGATSVWDEVVNMALTSSEPTRMKEDGHVEAIESISTLTPNGIAQDIDFGVDLSQPFEFDWIDHDFTNFCGANSFIGRLDYILPDRTTLRVARVAPMPQFEQAIMATGWPCVGHPSDHVSLLYDLAPPLAPQREAPR